MRPADAINAGYDEVTHINWIIMQAMPDEVIRDSNGILRFEGPGRYGKGVNLEGAAMRAIIGTMARRKIYSDPTMVAVGKVCTACRLWTFGFGLSGPQRSRFAESLSSSRPVAEKAGNLKSSPAPLSD